VLPLTFGVGLQLHRWWAGGTLWLDEQMIARNIRDRDFAGLAGPLDFNQSAPLGWLWTQRVVVELLGTGERALRLVPLVFGIGALVAAWAIGRRWLGPAGTFAVVSLLAVNAALLRYSTEVKQYSGDVFWALLLLGAALWVIGPAGSAVGQPGPAGGPAEMAVGRVERAPDPAGSAPGDRPVRWSYRMGWWWVVAAVGCLFSMGAILATPAIALVLVGVAGRRGGWPAVLRAAAAGVVWLAAFALHYWYALRHLLANEVMAEFWDSRGYPPDGAGPVQLVDWIVRRPEVLAQDPLHLDNAGLGRGWLIFAATIFWLLVLAGIGVAGRRSPAVALLLAAPPVTGVVLAVLHLAPLSARLAMWALPALFLAVGFEIDAATRAAARLLRRSGNRAPARGSRLSAEGGARLSAVGGVAEGGARLSGRGGRWAAGGVGMAAVAVAAVVLVPLAAAAVRPSPPPGIDDRAGVTWLVRQHRPGDLTLVLQGSQHAVAWYAPGDALAPTIRVRAVPYTPGCDLAGLRSRLAGFDRVLVYGRFRDGSAGAAAEALSVWLAEVGTVVEAANAGRVGISWVVQLDPEPDRPADHDASTCLTFT
jgi:hypothetical protein